MKIGAIFFLGFSVICLSKANAANPLSLDSKTSQLIEQCSNGIPTDIMIAITGIESNFNPYAIGIVNGYVSQPNNLNDAIQSVKRLHASGKNFSMGIAQVNMYNLKAYGLNYQTVFDPCKNLNAGSKILLDCFKRAEKISGSINEAWEKAFSCYYSGNFKTGFRQDFPNQPPYVAKIVNNLKRIQNIGSNAINNYSNVNYNYGDNSLANNYAIMQNNKRIELSENSSFDDGAIKVATIQNEIKGKVESVRNWEAFNEYGATKVSVF